jgi:hypothetical protein
MLEVSFVRRRGQRDHVYVHRDDGSETDWAFPTYGDGLPHDLCHLVVEQGLGLTDGFWGLVDQGVEVGLVNNQATLVRDGTPLTELPDADFRGLMQAEAAVAALGSPMHAVQLAGELVVGRPGVEDEPDDGEALPDPIDVSTAFSASVELPPTATPDAVAAIHAELRALAQRWRGLDDGGAITLTFTRGARVSGERRGS